MVSHLNATYDRKMEESLGKTFFDYVVFVKKNTPEGARILIPPYSAFPWPQTGNFAYMRYFLYPRELVSGEEYKPAQNLENFDYVLIAWGETPTTSGSFTHGWPKFDVNSKEITLLTANGNIIKMNSNYIYSKLKGRELWGLIKID